MTKNVKPIPDGHHTVTPYLMISGAAKALDFYKKAFGAKEVLRMDGPEGKVMHAEIQIGDSRIMVADEMPNMPDMGFRSPNSLGGTGVGILLYVPDVDALAKQATAAGAKVLRPVQDQFYGDRAGTFADPFGHMWTLSTHIEDVPPDELRKRAEAMCKGAAQAKGN
jgi:PhnB protein